jgi:hypothetical protein
MSAMIPRGISTASELMRTAPRAASSRSRQDQRRTGLYQVRENFYRWWQVLGSNQRRLSRQFYSPILLFEAYAGNLRLCVPRFDFGLPPSAMRPCAGSRRRGVARTGTDGGVRRLRLRAPIRDFVAFDLRCSRCHLAVAALPAPGSGSVSRVARVSVMRWLAVPSARPALDRLLLRGMRRRGGQPARVAPGAGSESYRSRAARMSSRWALAQVFRAASGTSSVLPRSVSS